MLRTGYILILDLLILALCALGVYRIAEKPGFPAGVDGTVITSIPENLQRILHAGDTIVTAGGSPIHAEDALEFLCNQYAIGDSIGIVVSHNGDHRQFRIELVRDNSIVKIIIESFAAFVFFFIGIAVLLLQQKEKAARIFHHLTIAIAALILLTPGIYRISPSAFGYAHGLLFYFSYTLVPVLFLHFTIVFPREKLHNSRVVLLPVYIAGLMLALWTSIAFLRAAYPSVDLSNYGSYQTAFTAILVFFAALFLAGFGSIIHSYVNTREEFERRKLRWVLFGIIFGAFAYICFSVIPRIFVRGLLFPEEYLIALTIIAPLSFAIAIVRYRVFDIDLIFSRSTAYTFVIIVLLAVYLGIVWLFSQIVLAVHLPSALPNMIGAMLVALLFEPLRKRMQKIIDKKFFRVSYDFYEAQRIFLEEIKFVTTKINLAHLLTERLNPLLQVTKIGFFVVESPGDRLRLLAHHGFDILERRQVPIDKTELKTSLQLPVALEELIEPGISFEAADRTVFGRWGIAIVLPMLSANKNILGFLILGEKRSGSRFTVEDVSLLLSVSTQAGLALERLNAEYSLMLEQAESERLSELNQLKSYFVSSVSHDLKTPLTSIRMFAEIMKEKEDLPRPKAQEYLGIIEGEADRLSRLITNVLDYARIEKGTKDYTFKPVDLNRVAGDVLQSLEYQMHSQGVTTNVDLTSGSLMVNADRDAIFDAITNLLTNAVKYSPPERRVITLRSGRQDGYAFLAVEDQGYGIPENEKEHIFESFYRISDSHMKSAGGAGLGLSLVRHTMDAHGGKVLVTSEAGNGSIFALYFPISSP